MVAINASIYVHMRCAQHTLSNSKTLRSNIILVILIFLLYFLFHFRMTGQAIRMNPNWTKNVRRYSQWTTIMKNSTWINCMTRHQQAKPKIMAKANMQVSKIKLRVTYSIFYLFGSK